MNQKEQDIYKYFEKKLLVIEEESYSLNKEIESLRNQFLQKKEQLDKLEELAKEYIECQKLLIRD